MPPIKNHPDKNVNILMDGLLTTTKINIMKKIFFIPLAAFAFNGIQQSANAQAAKKPKPFSTLGKTVAQYTTADNTTLRLSATNTVSFKEMGQPVETQVCVFVDLDKTFQTFFGIGAALTDASAETYFKLPKDKQQELLKAYFDKKDGIGYTIARTNINSCDFSSNSYTYVADNDKDLKTFDIAPDRKFKIPFITSGNSLNL